MRFGPTCAKQAPSRRAGTAQVCPAAMSSHAGLQPRALIVSKPQRQEPWWSKPSHGSLAGARSGRRRAACVLEGVAFGQAGSRTGARPIAQRQQVGQVLAQRLPAQPVRRLARVPARCGPCSGPGAAAPDRGRAGERGRGPPRARGGGGAGVTGVVAVAVAGRRVTSARRSAPGRLRVLRSVPHQVTREQGPRLPCEQPML